MTYYTKEDSGGQLPFVTVIIPMRNEEHFIGTCLESILANDYPSSRLEILIIDGMSEDRSRELVQGYAKKYPFVRTLENPRQIQASALNIGIKECHGDIIIRMDAHTVYASDYIRQCVKLLQTTEAANVGGVQCAVGTNYITKAIALATVSPFGIGDAKFRYATKEMWVDTVYLGAWQKDIFRKIGVFEEWVANEDYEFNHRLRIAGGKILLSPKIRCKYYARDSLKKLSKQHFRYGMWKVKTLNKHPDSLRYRQLAPPIFISSMVVSLLTLPFLWQIGILIPLFYIIANFGASLRASSKKGLKYSIILPLIFIIIHFSWGFGFLFGLKEFGLPAINIPHILNSFKEIK